MISPDGTLVASGGIDGLLFITNIATQAKVYTAPCEGTVRAFLPFSLDSFVLTIAKGEWCRLVARRDASCRRCK